MHANTLSDGPRKGQCQSVVTGWGVCEKQAIESFCKKVGSVGERDQPCCPVAAIGDAQGQMVADERRVGRRWGGYFERLLGPNGDSGDDGFSAQDILEREPEVLRSGVGGGGGVAEISKDRKGARSERGRRRDGEGGWRGRCGTAVESKRGGLER